MDFVCVIVADGMIVFVGVNVENGVAVCTEDVYSIEIDSVQA